MSLRPINFIDGAEDALLRHLDSMPNKSKYVKDLIKRDMGMPTSEQMIVDRIANKIESLLQLKIQSACVPTKEWTEHDRADISDMDLQNIRSILEEVGA